MDILNELIINNITEIVTVAYSKNEFTKVNKRGICGLTFCTEGQRIYTQNGIEYISDTGHALFLPKGSAYTIQGNKNGIFPVINFTCEEFTSDTILSVPITNIDLYIKDYEQMKSLFLFKRNRLKIISILYNMIYRLSASTSTQTGILEPAIRYIEDNYPNQDISNSFLAELCNISEVHFRKLFKDSLGITPKQYILDARILKAKQLLTDGILKISAVSEKCGFSSQYHFCRIFKLKTGTTPTEYMRQNQIYRFE